MTERDTARAAYERMLLGLWHIDDEDLDRAVTDLAADDLVIHTNGAERHGPDALADLIRQGRAPFTDIDVSIDTGPAIDGDLIAARWSFSGIYAGGVPDATAAPGTRVAFTGIDLVRVDGERVREYWVCSDGVALMAQLRV